MPVNVTFKVDSVQFGATTWSAATTGGPIEVGYNYSSAVQENRTGDNEYPTVIALPDKTCSVTVTLRDVKQTLPINGTPAALSFTITGKDGVLVTVTFATMVVAGVGGGQRRGDFGQVQVRFVHQSAAGQTLPVSV